MKAMKDTFFAAATAADVAADKANEHRERAVLTRSEREWEQMKSQIVIVEGSG